MEGYESSDSEDSDGGKSKAVGDEDDMFAMDEDDDKKEKDSDKKKKVQYLKKEEIEGQEWAKTDEFTEDGIKIDAFNMDEDLEEGYVIVSKILSCIFTTSKTDNVIMFVGNSTKTACLFAKKTNTHTTIHGYPASPKPIFKKPK